MRVVIYIADIIIKSFSPHLHLKHRAPIITHHVQLECEILQRQEIWGRETDDRADIITASKVYLKYWKRG